MKVYMLRLQLQRVACPGNDCKNVEVALGGSPISVTSQELDMQSKLESGLRNAYYFHVVGVGMGLVGIIWYLVLWCRNKERHVQPLDRFQDRLLPFVVFLGGLICITGIAVFHKDLNPIQNSDEDLWFHYDHIQGVGYSAATGATKLLGYFSQVYRKNYILILRVSIVHDHAIVRNSGLFSFSFSAHYDLGFLVHRLIDIGCNYGVTSAGAENGWMK